MRSRILVQSLLTLAVFAVAFVVGQAQCRVANETPQE